MDERELDRAIDMAAASLVARDPRRPLSYEEVMARAREDATPSRHRLVWLTAAASILLVTAMATALMYLMPNTPPAVPAARPFAVARPLARVEPPMAVTNDVRPARSRRSASAAAGRDATAAGALPDDISPIAPLETEPIVVAVIEVPRLEPVAPASIEALSIEQLTIEPLAASND